MTNTYDPKAALATAAHAVTLTPAALAHVQRELMKQGGGAGLQVGVKPAGCTGYKYVVALVKTPDPTHYCFAASDPSVQVFVDLASMPFVKGMTIDYEKQGLNSQFVYHNPNVKDACGCGESFNIVEDEASNI